ncbi:MAG: hypothetical protein E5X58_10195 [Mesorhizobium sp.]|nr:MAG: hypothetical protein E5X58_10195 [Mesorhizobium sp.]
MMGIDRSVMAAARSMGARPLTAFWRVFFPLSLLGVRSGSLLVFVFCLVDRDQSGPEAATDFGRS